MLPPRAPPQEAAAWWKVAKHLDEALLAATIAMTLNVDDPTAVHALQGRLREAQATLLEIFWGKGLLPGGMPAAAPVTVAAAVGAPAAAPPAVAPAPASVPAASTPASASAPMAAAPVSVEASEG
jgi:hypothetical protein